ncbi:MAG: GatB/YqeY domain-containing protein [Proteobacteria bacterium]|nr:GatB/YqeY domain-containing protein [Pseudomonadota bacterium]
MSLKETITNDIKQAMLNKNNTLRDTLRMISAEIKQLEVDKKITVSDDDVISILNKMAKQRKDSIQQFQQGGREDLASIEINELEIITTYLPAQLSEEEIDIHINEAIASLGATSPQDMGKVMGALKPLLNGKADMGIVSAAVKSKLIN